MKTITDELDEIIYKIPDELKDCFAILISKENGDKLLKEHSRFIDIEKVHFPITYKNIPVALHKYTNTHLEVIRIKDKVQKVYAYEMKKVNSYLKELENICKKYNIELGGCGCCGSPSIYNLKTISVDYINYRDGKLKYELYILPEMATILKGGDEK